MRFKKPGLEASKTRSRQDAGYVVVELGYDSAVTCADSQFAGPDSAKQSVSTLNKILSDVGVKEVKPHFDMSASKLRKRVTQASAMSAAKSVSADFAQAGFVRVRPKRKKDASKLAQRMNRAGAVWQAQLAPVPTAPAAPSGASKVSRNFEPSQGYLSSAPNGIGAVDAWQQFPKAKGQTIRICDIEGDWNFNHEDLPKIQYFGGDLLGAGWRDHGTAVLGEMVSKPGVSGTVGISHRARPCVHSAVINGVWNTAGAIMAAANRLKAGDAILIELQGTGPNGKYVAMQYWNDVYSAIRVATKKGITVVEAAGNGNENFDLPVFNGTGLQKDSGAILVGAGVPPTNHWGNFGSDWGFTDYTEIGPPRSRLWFSNYGKILNLQGWGWHVTTCGYGDAQGGNENQWYTLRFSGTSSASPIVTGAVACVQSLAKAKNGAPLSPADVRAILMKTGTAQVASAAAPLAQKIGRLPNLPKALALV